MIKAYSLLVGILDDGFFAYGRFWLTRWFDEIIMGDMAVIDRAVFVATVRLAQPLSDLE